MKRRAQTVLLRARGHSYREIAEAVGCGISTVHDDLVRWNDRGESAFLDLREENGARKVDEDFLQCLWEVLQKRAYEWGWSRPTWTRELLILTLEKRMSVRVSRRTMGRALKVLGVRRGRPKPVVLCPWSKSRKTRALNKINRLLAKLRPDEVVLYEDEVDIHLNPKIGPDYMLPGQQWKVVTPGRNRKRYLAGAMDARTGRITWVEAKRKNTDLFLALCKRLAAIHPRAKSVHLILDNYVIHKTKKIVKELSKLGGKIVLHFLPPYCPDENSIERVWKDLHDQVTRNHPYKSMAGLMKRVREFMSKRERRISKTSRKAA